MRTPQIRYPSRPSTPLRPSPARLLGVGAVLAALLLAGCTAGGGDENLKPDASLEVNQEEGWTGEEFVFDARGSEDSDGEITSWTFDFGDDSPPRTVTEDEAAQVSHVYAKGGEYTVTVTVTDNGKENTGALTDTESTNVAVNEKVAIASTAVSTLPDDEQDATARQSVPFQVYEEANRYELNMTFTSVLPTGSSEFVVKVVDPNNETVGEPETITVGPGTEGQSVTLEGLLTKQGLHRVAVEAKSGGGAGEGELRVYYGEKAMVR